MRQHGGVSDTSKLTALGSGPPAYRYDHPEASMLEVFDNQHRDRAWLVALECAEFTSLCPMTGQPDFGHLRIVYVPGPLCVESKSLKLYLGAYRNHGTFHEDCVNRIADDLAGRISPQYLRVFGDFRPRGGIAIRPLAVRTGPGLPADALADALALVASHDALARFGSAG
jgi:7-cyano-7-deazaguanine reductase